jgi:sulfite reductase (NADPH) flavoprotein alpha-component
MIQKEHLNHFHVALSREAEHIYVMDLIKRDALFFVDLLKQGGVIMICGSLAMQKDVESILNELCLANGAKNLSEYKTNHQLLIDCY